MAGRLAGERCHLLLVTKAGGGEDGALKVGISEPQGTAAEKALLPLVLAAQCTFKGPQNTSFVFFGCARSLLDLSSPTRD